ncbi:hypothetical protein GF356_08255 [candidate division GN15 bacterium]|nr:hypothetical protein [candidate division GN15 bacterium]
MSQSLRLPALLILLVALLSIVTTHADNTSAGEFTAEQATEFADSIFPYFKAADWNSYASHLHPEALGELKDLVVGIVAVDTTGQFSTMFLGGRTPQQVQELAPETLFVDFFESFQVLVPQMKQIITSTESTTIGAVPENEKFHVVYRARSKMQGSEIVQVDVLTVKPHDGQLKAMLTADIQELINSLSEMIR